MASPSERKEVSCYDKSGFLSVPALIAGLSSQASGCDSTPTAVRDGGSGGNPQFAATHSELATTFSLVDDPADCTANPRLGEFVLFTGQVTYVETTTSTGSGNVNASWYFNYDPGVRLVGQASGRVWMIDATSTHPTGHADTHGDGFSSENSTNEFYIGTDGDRLHLRGNEHLTVDANGKVTVTRPFVWECIGS